MGNELHPDFWQEKDRIFDAMHRQVAREERGEKTGSDFEMRSTFQIARDSDRELKRSRGELIRPDYSSSTTKYERSDFSDEPFSDES